MWLVPAAALAAFIGAGAGTAGALYLAVRLYLPKLLAAVAPTPRDPRERPAWAPPPVEEMHPGSVVVGSAQFSRMRRMPR